MADLVRLFFLVCCSWRFICLFFGAGGVCVFWMFFFILGFLSFKCGQTKVVFSIALFIRPLTDLHCVSSFSYLMSSFWFDSRFIEKRIACPLLLILLLLLSFRFLLPSVLCFGRSKVLRVSSTAFFFFFTKVKWRHSVSPSTIVTIVTINPLVSLSNIWPSSSSSSVSSTAFPSQ